MNGAVLFTILLYLISNHLSPFLIFLILMNIAVSLSYPMFLQNSELVVNILLKKDFLMDIIFNNIRKRIHQEENSIKKE